MQSVVSGSEAIPHYQISLYAPRASVDGAGECAGLAGEVEVEVQTVQVQERLPRQGADGVLRHVGEHGIAQLVEQRRGQPRAAP